MSLFKELTRRRVIRAAVAYAPTAWIVAEVARLLTVAIDEPVAVWRPWTSAMAHYALGQSDESEQHLAELIKLHAHDAAFQIAEVCAFRNETDASFEWLERAYQQRDPGLAEIQYFVAFANLRNKRRYKALLKKLNLA